MGSFVSCHPRPMRRSLPLSSLNRSKPISKLWVRLSLFCLIVMLGPPSPTSRTVAAYVPNKDSNNHPKKGDNEVSPQLGNLKLRHELSSEEVRSRHFRELERLRERDRQSKAIAPKVRIGWFLSFDERKLDTLVALTISLCRMIVFL